MPESPEVHALAAFLDQEAAGRRIGKVDVLEFRIVKTRSSPPSSVVGGTITGARRHGKHVELMLDERSLVVSLGRHGWLRWAEGSSAGSAAVDDESPALATFELSGDRVLEVTDAGTWVSLGLFVVAEARDVPAIAKLGPDPADAEFSRADFDAAFGARRKQVKAVLQEQESLSGIGNAYSDEILHAARVSPVAHAATLGEDERERLFRATVATVTGAMNARRGVPIDQLKLAKVAAMRVHGRAGEACPVCGTAIREHRFAGAVAHYCATCQTGGAVL